MEITTHNIKIDIYKKGNPLFPSLIIITDEILDETLVETWIRRREKIEKIVAYRNANPKTGKNKQGKNIQGPNVGRNAIQGMNIKHKWSEVVLN